MFKQAAKIVVVGALWCAPAWSGEPKPSIDEASDLYQRKREAAREEYHAKAERTREAIERRRRGEPEPKPTSGPAEVVVGGFQQRTEVPAWSMDHWVTTTKTDDYEFIQDPNTGWLTVRKVTAAMARERMETARRIEQERKDRELQDRIDRMQQYRKDHELSELIDRTAAKRKATSRPTKGK